MDDWKKKLKQVDFDNLATFMAGINDIEDELNKGESVRDKLDTFKLVVKELIARVENDSNAA